jgi:hypothetical protein
MVKQEVSHKVSGLIFLLARKSGGEFIHAKPEISASEVAGKLGRVNFGFISATFDTKIVSEVFPSIPTPVTGNTLKVAGSISPKVKDFSTPIQLVRSLFFLPPLMVTESHFSFRTTGMVRKLHTA